MRHISRNGAAQKWLDRHACLIFLAPAFFFYTLFWIVPMLGAFIISFSRWNGIGFDRIKWVGTANYSKLLGDRFFWTSLENNLIFVGGIVGFCGAAGYAFAHFQFRGKALLFLYFLAGMMIPPQVILIPAFKMMSLLGLVNTYYSVILTYFAWVPFAIYFFRAYFAGIPKELVEAARIDGASELSIFFRIMLPLARPAFVTVAIIYFVWIFNDFMWPLVYLNNNEVRTVTLGMMNFQGQYSSATTLKTAALILATLPPVIVFLIFSRQIQGGLVDGALKS